MARLVPDPFTYWLTTTDPKDKVVLERLIEKYKGAVQTALREAALKYPFGVSALQENE